MTRNEVIKNFLAKKFAKTPTRKQLMYGYCGDGISSLTSYGETLVSYSTLVAKWDGDKVLITPNKYSPTTSRQLGELRRECAMAGIETGELW